MMLPPPLQGWLPAGWLAFTGRESNPLDHDERFPSCYISSPLPGFILTLRHPKPVTATDSCTAAKFSTLLNDLIGQSKQHGRDREAEFLGGSEVDYQLELGRLLRW